MRQQHLDMARAVSIALVVLGHGPIGHFHPDIQHALGNIRMPLLFMLAGMHLRPQASWWATCRTKADALLKPYLVMALLLGLYTWQKGELTDPAAYWLDVASFNGVRLPGWLFPMWFLTLLFALHVAASPLARIDLRGPGHRLGGWALCGVLLLAGHLALPSAGLDTERCVDVGLGYPGWFFNLDLLPLGLAWFLAGHLMATSWRDDTPSWLDALAWTLGFATVVVAAHPSLDMLARWSDAPLASCVATWMGAQAVIGWSRLLTCWTPARQALAPLGRYSLYLLLFHAPVQSLSANLLTQISPDHAEAMQWIASVIVLAACPELGRIIQRHRALLACFEPMHRVRSAAAIAAVPKPQPLAISHDDPDEHKLGTA